MQRKAGEKGEWFDSSWSEGKNSLQSDAYSQISISETVLVPRKTSQLERRPTKKSLSYIKGALW